MCFVKDLYIDQMERRWSELVDQGLDPSDAYDMASEAAYHDLGDRMADMADAERLRRKEGK